MKKWLIDLVKEGYLCLVWVVARSYDCFYRSSKKKGKQPLVVLINFPHSSEQILMALAKDRDICNKMVIFYENTCLKEIQALKQRYPTLCIQRKANRWEELRFVVPKLVQAKVVLCDNYYPFFASLGFLKKMTVVQLWHANGAIKKFGLEDQQWQTATWLAQKRYQRVYRRFDFFIVSSKKMSTIFTRSYGAKNDQFKNWGYPRSDIFFNQKITQQKKQLYQEFPELKKKKLILYVPTYRTAKVEWQEKLMIEAIYHALQQDYLFVFRPHPTDFKQMTSLIAKMSQYPTFFHVALAKRPLPVLLQVTDILITDYSSVLFDYTLAKPNGRVVLYPFDLATYQKEVGIQPDFYQLLKKEGAHSLEQVLFKIKQKKNSVALAEFNQSWNTYNDGQAMKRTMAFIKTLIQ